MRGIGDLKFYQGKRVFLTGHTGFKGSWLSHMLLSAGARVTGYALKPDTQPSLFSLLDLGTRMTNVYADIRDFDALRRAYEQAAPDVVFHLAAQPIVRESYRAPRYTYETNVMGTVNLLECLRTLPGARSLLNVTTDKVYANREWCWGYRENEQLDGFDPYSNSKSCSELATHSYTSSFFQADGAPSVSTARAGNVIGGGDFAMDRIIPDCVRAMSEGRKIGVRNPDSIRPYQHVLEPLAAYLMIAGEQYIDRSRAGYYNVGPDEADCVTTGALADLFCAHWGEGAAWENQSDPNAPHEANYLRLDCSKLKQTFGWQPRWHIDQAVEATCAFHKAWLRGEQVAAEADKEIQAFWEMG